MKRIIEEVAFTAEQLNKISSLSKICGLSRRLVAILYGRGIDTPDKIEAFTHPSKQRFLNPLLMSGMDRAVELIKCARDEDWSVAVYGDYDADGICASTVLARSLKEYGIEPYVYVPERRNGYGLSSEAIDAIFEECFPQLIITVDCGISNADMVEYIKEQGAEVIVTDHHELPEVLPDCICINPKIEDNYPYDNLCGAGVAFKLACALIGKQAYKYLDFVAIATVADSVPLINENRDIVYEGLQIINSRPRKNYLAFLSKQGEKVTSQSIAFSIQPKINAAGRMGDANTALQLFLSDDDAEIYDSCVKLTEYNIERQKYCDELYLSAKQKIKEKGADGKVILLWDDKWNSGFVGIVAARLAEEYCRPTLLFVKNGDVLKGSVRSIEGINIFEALKSCSDLIEEFGGHSQAAGVNIAEDNLSALEERLNAYLCANYSNEAFTPSYLVCGQAAEPYSDDFIRELELLEPCGVGNKKPQFVLKTKSCQARLTKFGSQHLSVKCFGQDHMYFSGKKHERLLKSKIEKYILFDCAVNTFRGKEQIKRYIRDVLYDTGDVFAEDIKKQVELNGLDLLSGECTAADVVKITKDDAQKALDRRSGVGCIFIAYDPTTPSKYDFGDIEVNAFSVSAAGLADVLVVSPVKDCDFSAYERVVFLDNPGRISIPSLAGKRVEVCEELEGLEFLKKIDCNREELLSTFRFLSKHGTESGVDWEDVAQSGGFATPVLQTVFALKVFEELELITFTEGKVYVNRGVKTQLTNSGLYNFVVEYENGH